MTLHLLLSTKDKEKREETGGDGRVEHSRETDSTASGFGSFTDEFDNRLFSKCHRNQAAHFSKDWRVYSSAEEAIHVSYLQRTNQRNEEMRRYKRQRHETFVRSGWEMIKDSHQYVNCQRNNLPFLSLSLPRPPSLWSALRRNTLCPCFSCSWCRSWQLRAASLSLGRHCFAWPNC